jgi:hypothetical protein
MSSLPTSYFPLRWLSCLKIKVPVLEINPSLRFISKRRPCSKRLRGPERFYGMVIPVMFCLSY